MENEEKKCEGGKCKDGSCCGMSHMGMCGYGGKHHLIKIILKLVIVMIIFCFGFKLGEITGSIRGGDDWDRGEKSGYKMMRGYNYNYNNLPNQNVQNTAPVAPNPTPKQ